MKNMKTLNLAAIGGALCLGLVSNQVLAQTTVDTWSHWASISDFTGTVPFEGITITDKTITLVDADASVTIQGTNQNAATLTSNRAFATATTGKTDPSVTFELLGNGRHQVTFAGPGAFDFAGTTTASIVAVQYVINIDTSTYPPDSTELRFGTIDLGLNVNSAGGLTVSKRIQGLTPATGAGGEILWTANNNYAIGRVFDKTISTGTQTNATEFCGICTTFLVTDYVTFSAADGNPTSLSSISNTYEQVPVPAPLALLAAGLLGLRASRRFKKTV